jgi:hypothetical protein
MDISNRLGRLESIMFRAPGPRARGGALADRLSDHDAALKRLAERIDSLDRHTEDNAKTTTNIGAQVESLTGMVGRLQRSDTGQTAIQQNDHSALADYMSRLQALEEKLGSLEDRVENIKAATEPADQPLRMAMIAATLRMAAERGFSYAPELDSARALGFDAAAIAALEPFAETGIPSQNDLSREMSSNIPELLRVSVPAAHEGTSPDRQQAGDKLVRIRPVGDTHGDDPASIINRIEVAMTHRDLAAIIAEIDKLPPPAKAIAQDWQTRARQREAALAAVRRMESASFSALGEQAAPDPR